MELNTRLAVGVQEIAEQNTVARDIYALFNSELGKRCLQHLEAMTIQKPNLPAGGVDGVSMAMGMSLREGENQLYRKIKMLIRTGERVAKNVGES